jgi:hypothetical protein
MNFKFGFGDARMHDAVFEIFDVDHRCLVRFLPTDQEDTCVSLLLKEGQNVALLWSSPGEAPSLQGANLSQREHTFSLRAYRPTTWRSSLTTFSNSSAAELAEDAPLANCSFTCVVT